jgi:peptide/nickel transport system substrate-binding protein
MRLKMKRYWSICIASLLLVAMLTASCTGSSGGNASGNDFVQMTTGDIESFDPAWGYDTASCEQVQYIYEPLLFYDGNSTDTFRPVLATEWNASPDGRTFRFHIRSGVHFQSGDTLTPQDVEYSFERAMVQNRVGGPTWMFYAPLLGLNNSRDGNGDVQVTFNQIDHAVEVDGNWVQFNLVAAYPTLIFYQTLCSTWASIVDKAWCVAHGDWDGTASNWTAYNNPDVGDSYLYGHVNGTGPWTLETWKPGVQITLVRNDNYWGAPAPFERIITKIVGGWMTRKEALLHGDADLVYVPRDCIGELMNVTDLNVYKDLPELSIDAFFFNMDIASDSPYIGSGALDGNGIPTTFFSDINVRKGLSCAFNYDAYLRDAMQGDAIQPGSPVIKGVAYYNPDTPKYSYNLTQAAAYLQAAWNGTVWDKGFNFTLAYNPGSIPRPGKIACDILAEGLSTISDKFQISVQPVQFSTMLEMITSGAMPMYQLGWMFDYPDPDDSVGPFMASYGWFAHGQSYGYPELDELIAEGETTVDSATRQAIYYQLQQIYYDDAPSIMLAQPLGRRYFTKYILGFYFNPMIPGLPGPLYYMSKSSP